MRVVVVVVSQVNHNRYYYEKMEKKIKRCDPHSLNVTDHVSFDACNEYQQQQKKINHTINFERIFLNWIESNYIFFVIIIIIIIIICLLIIIIVKFCFMNNNHNNDQILIIREKWNENSKSSYYFIIIMTKRIKILKSFQKKRLKFRYLIFFCSKIMVAIILE